MRAASASTLLKTSGGGSGVPQTGGLFHHQVVRHTRPPRSRRTAPGASSRHWPAAGVTLSHAAPVLPCRARLPLFFRATTAPSGRCTHAAASTPAKLPGRMKLRVKVRVRME